MMNRNDQPPKKLPSCTGCIAISGRCDFLGLCFFYCYHSYRQSKPYLLLLCVFVLFSYYLWRNDVPLDSTKAGLLAHLAPAAYDCRDVFYR